MATPLDPTLIPKFVNPLVIPPVYEPEIVKSDNGKLESHDHTVTMSEFCQQILPPEFPATTVWGYGGRVRDSQTGEIIPDFRHTPGATFEAVRGVPINVQWVNLLTEPHALPVDPTIHWANPNNMDMPEPPFPSFPPGFPLAQYLVPVAPHLHGGENEPESDGHPEAWFTAGEVITGPTFNKSRYHYCNRQESTTLWYHDHALGITRLNVLMGLAGFYLLRDPHHRLDKDNSVLPKGEFEIPIAIQDRSFNADGSFAFPTEGINPDAHPYWVPEFFGDSIMVNGRVWPYLNVEPRQYRFRVLNGSSARFYNLKFSNQMPFLQIGTDGGYLVKPAESASLLLAPGERADILVDFSDLSPGTKVVLQNDANAPFPDGDMPDPLTTGQIMQFAVVDKPKVQPAKLPGRLNFIKPLVRNSKKRTLVLVEVMGTNGPLEVLLNGQHWDAPVSENPLVGSTEDWELINLTMDAHPIHLHLVQFHLISRQELMADKYAADWYALNGIMPPYHHKPKALAVKPYLLNDPVNPPGDEKGWKDTIRANPGEVTTIRVRFAPQNAPLLTIPGLNYYPFNPTKCPGYAWHCHILDHEDNEMMRPYKVRGFFE